MPRSTNAKIARRRPLPATPAVFRIGYVPLLDAAPLIVAEALGFFSRAGLDVELSRELGWGSVREKIVYGELDGAAAPGGLLFSILLGTHAPACPVSTDMVLNLQGNAITLSRGLWERGVRDARTLRLTLRSGTPRRITFAAVSAFSSHHFLIREWLRSADLDPDRDVRITVLPPPLVAEHMRQGQIDGFCVGEPWNSAAALDGDGWVAATSADLAPGHPEKVLIMRADSKARNPEAYALLRQALIDACRYCDLPENRPAVAALLLERGIFSLPIETLRNGLVGSFHNGFEATATRRPFLSFDRNRASFEQATWCLNAIVESKQITLDPKTRQRCLSAFIDLGATPRPSRKVALSTKTAVAKS